MNIIITGNRGFLGKRLVKRLSEKGHNILGISKRYLRNMDNNLHNIDLSSNRAIFKLKKLINDFGAPYIIIHLAAIHPGFKYVSSYIKNNVLATANLLDATCGNSPELIIYTSTQSVYGDSEKNPVNESHSKNCSTPYAISKNMSEKIVQGFKKNKIILRLPSMYGFGQKNSLIDGICKLVLENKPVELFSEGKTFRDAVHVSDIVKAIENCIVSPPGLKSTIINLGCGEKITVFDYTLELKKALNSYSKIIPIKRPGKLNFYCDISRARSLINYKPLELHDSMKLYAKEIMENNYF